MGLRAGLDTAVAKRKLIEKDSDDISYLVNSSDWKSKITYSD
jgi:hypothetical protein